MRSRRSDIRLAESALKSLRASAAYWQGTLYTAHEKLISFISKVLDAFHEIQIYDARAMRTHEPRSW